MKINLMTVKSIENMYKKQNENSYRQNKIDQKSDKLEISKEAKYLSKISSSNDEIEMNKIYEIKNKINSRNYSVDSKDIAKKILEKIKESKNW